MHTPAILGLATNVPANRYSQQEILDFFVQVRGTDARRARATRVVWERAGVAYRHMAVDGAFYLENQTTGARNARYMQEAMPLGEATVRQALDIARVAPEAVDDFIVVSCTGYHVPGLDLQLAGKLGFRPDLRRTAVLGMGCYGAFPGLLRAREAVVNRPGRHALMLSLELCSLHLQLDESTETIVSTALFSDGAGAVVVGADDNRQDAWENTPRLVDSATHCDYSTLDHMTFTLTDHGFRMYLSSYVPDLLAASIEQFVDGLLKRNGLTREGIRFWGIHPGSTKIVDYVQQRLGLSDWQVESSHAILREYGNMSSATILFVLDHIQRCRPPSKGDYAVLLAFGPGLTMEGALLQW